MLYELPLGSYRAFGDEVRLILLPEGRYQFDRLSDECQTRSSEVSELTRGLDDDVDTGTSQL